MVLVAVMSAGAAAETAPASAPATAPAVSVVGPEEFAKAIGKEGVVVLDVRTPKEFAAGHLEGAVNVDFRGQAFEEAMAKFEKNKTYAVYCASGARSTAACSKMSKMGFEKLTNLRGGIEAWKNAKKPVVVPAG
jgi:rhodanese-related sulfurtransferase